MTVMVDDSQALLRRVVRLEKQNRIWRLVTIVAIIILAAFPILWFAMEQGALESKSFVLVDHQGKRRAVLASDQDGSPSLVFYSKEGKIQVLLNTKPDGTSSIDLYDQSGKVLFKAP
jgi:hypothetical protein